MNALESIFRLVVDASWRISCLIVIFLALRSILRRRVSARVLFWVWVAVALRLIVPFAAPVKWSPFNLTRFTKLHAAAFADSESASESGMSDPSRGLPAPLPPVHSSGVRPAHSPAWTTVQSLAIVWSVGIAVLVIGRFRTSLRFESRLRRTGGKDGNAFVPFSAETAARFGLGKVRIVVSDAIGAPALCGMFRPKILFPPGLLERLTPLEVKLIVAHEMGHCDRWDLGAQALIHAAQILHWFNPLVWVAARVARQDCELACDEHVLRRSGSVEPRIYGATLIKIIGLVSQTVKAPLILGIVESKQHMKRRIEMIIANNTPTFARTLAGCTLLGLVGVLSLTKETRAQEPAAVTPVQQAAAITPAQAPVSAASPNVTVKAPAGWWKNGSKPAAYVAGVDRDQMHNGLPSAYVKSLNPSIDGFGGMMQMCSAVKFNGKRLRYSAWMKTEDAKDGGAHLWFRVDGKENDVILQFDNMGNRPVMGTTDWQLYSLVLDVPDDAGALAYGFFVSGTGKAWVSGAKIEEVGLDQAITNIPISNARNLPKAPVNLTFE
jgi:bla regulator protein blaR1